MKAWSEERVQFEKAMEQDGKHEQKTDQAVEEKEAETPRKTAVAGNGKEAKPDEAEAEPDKEAKPETGTKREETGTGAIKESERGEEMPPGLLEKGIIYFFFRPRVNVEDPQSMNDVSRSFIVMRPTPRGAKIEKGVIGDAENCRLLMVPRKKFPTSGREREMGFVEKAKVSMTTLRETFVAGEKHETKTRGERTTPEAKPYAEGVYAITKTARSSHLAYILTVPPEPGDLQHDFGLYKRGSFVFQSKNPQFPGPPHAQLPKGPEYPESVMEKFGDLRWAPAEPEFLDYPNAQFLMVGERQEELGKAGIAETGKEPHQKQPGEELEQLEEENEERMEHLDGNHAVFEDLGLDAQKYADIPTTWET